MLKNNNNNNNNDNDNDNDNDTIRQNDTYSFSVSFWWGKRILK